MKSHRQSHPSYGRQHRTRRRHVRRRRSGDLARPTNGLGAWPANHLLGDGYRSAHIQSLCAGQQSLRCEAVEGLTRLRAL